ncbi:MAG: DUF2809 domain-containing protein [Saprospiraceae bacterium]|nr:DUF2809 domain-containing protein [Saprospiraceae bacterium]
MLKFNRKYFLLALLIFILEVLIALYVHDRFVRPYVGDVLVVILLYCFAKAFLDLPALHLALGVLAFSFAIEIMQFFEVVELLGLGSNQLARVVIGTSFAWEDFLAYTAGILVVIIVENQQNR